MKFRYQAKTKEGELQVGFVEAGSRDTALNILAGHELFVLSIETAEKIRWYDRLVNYFNRVRREDMVVFTRQLAILLEARLPLTRTLQTLYEQTTNPILKEAVFHIAEDVDSGLAFSQAIERQPGVFSEFFISMIRSGEVTGNLDQVAKFLADHTERDAILISKAKSALIYPSVVLALFVVVAFIMITFVFPQIQPVFEQAEVELPIFAKALIVTGVFLGKWWLAIILVLVVLLLMGLDYLETPEGKAMKDDLKIRLPIVNRVYLPLTIARFANAGAMLIKGGVPIAQAMEIVGETVDNVLYRDLLRQISQDIREGKTLSEAISKNPTYFPQLVSQMISVGEATGQIDQILLRVATYYGREAESSVSNLLELLQPALMVLVGVLTGLLFASILLPLYKLTSAIR
jgi:type IV pilus assembly protein PilC